MANTATPPAHTAEPWKAISEPWLFDGIPTIVTGKDGGMILATVTHSGRGNYEGQLGDPLADAHRIVECVNACEGINPETVPDLLEYCKGFLEDVREMELNPDVAGYRDWTMTKKNLEWLIEKAERRS